MGILKVFSLELSVMENTEQRKRFILKHWNLLSIETQRTLRDLGFRRPTLTKRTREEGKENSFRPLP